MYSFTQSHKLTATKRTLIRKKSLIVYNYSATCFGPPEPLVINVKYLSREGTAKGRWFDSKWCNWNFSLT